MLHNLSFMFSITDVMMVAGIDHTMPMQQGGIFDSAARGYLYIWKMRPRCGTCVLGRRVRVASDQLADIYIVSFFSLP